MAATRHEATTADDRLARVALIALACLAPLLGGLVSVGIGQDANWDLRNYHRYIPWAFLTGRVDLDLAPAGTPSYFNPLLDLPHYWAERWMPPRLLAFAMGASQALSALVVYRIALQFVQGPRARRVAVLCAFTACLGGAFLSEFGNTMGDNVTALVMLASFAIVLRARTPGRSRPLALLLVAGLVAGIGIGAKLTNVPYAIGLVAAAFAARNGSGPNPGRRVAAVVAGLAAGVVIAYGLWAAFLVVHFGNPLFPQFNRMFGAPLASATLVADLQWRVRSVSEALLFPIVFTIFPMRVSEIPIANILWPIVYVLGAAYAARRLVRTASAGTAHDATPLFAFVGASYVTWLCLLPIGRYAIGIELLLPLSAWLLAERLFAARSARRAGLALTLFIAIYPFMRYTTWGSAGFADARAWVAPYRVEVPVIRDPEHATVLVLTMPVAWMLPEFPAATAFMALDTNFPASDAYVARVRATIARRGGPLYAILPADEVYEGSGRWKLNRLLDELRATDGDPLCGYARALFDHAPASDVAYSPNGGRCHFDRDVGKRPTWARDAAVIAQAVERHGVTIDLARCTAHGAWIGDQSFPFRFCPATLR